MHIHTVSEVTKFIQNLLNHSNVLNNLIVTGELGNLRQDSTTCSFFTIKDDKCSLKCIMNKNIIKQVKDPICNGTQVICYGSITLHNNTGIYQLSVSKIIPAGTGTISAKLSMLKERLKSLGLFDNDVKKTLPVFPSTIGILTSSSGAVLHDIFHVAKKRNPHIKLILFPIKVQGENAHKQIIHGIDIFNQKYPVDIIIIARGGGAQEDFSPFNEEEVIKAIYLSQIPIISAVGHETDFTLSDFAADIRAATPSQAAEIAVPEITKTLEHLQYLQSIIKNIVRKSLTEKYHKVNRYSQFFFSKNIIFYLQKKQDYINQLSKILYYLNKNHIKIKNQLINSKINQLNTINPFNVLNHGYSILEKNNQFIKSVKQISSDDKLTISLFDGFVDVKIEIISKRRNNNVKNC